MKWITRRHVHVNRTATAWLVRRFLDPEAEILFVAPESVAPRARALEAISFDAPGARYPYRDRQGRCSFEQLAAERLPADRALARLAAIVHGAEFPEEIAAVPESSGLWAISQGLTLASQEDAEIVDRAASVYDALYAHLKRSTED